MSVDDAALRAARTQIVSTCRALAGRKLVYGTSGNVSVRLGDVIAVSPSTVPYDEMTPEMVCLVDLQGNILSQAGPNPSSEVPLHTAVYAATEAEAIVHAHSPAAVAAGSVFDEIPAIHYMVRGFGGAVPVVPYARFGSTLLAEHVAEAMSVGDRTAVLMRNHGGATTAATLPEALDRYEALEWLCDVYLRAASAGSPALLTQDDLDEVTRAAKKKGYRP